MHEHRPRVAETGLQELQVRSSAIACDASAEMGDAPDHRGSPPRCSASATRRRSWRGGSSPRRSSSRIAATSGARAASASARRAAAAGRLRAARRGRARAVRRQGHEPAPPAARAFRASGAGAASKARTGARGRRRVAGGRLGARSAAARGELIRELQPAVNVQIGEPALADARDAARARARRHRGPAVGRGGFGGARRRARDGGWLMQRTRRNGARPGGARARGLRVLSAPLRRRRCGRRLRARADRLFVAGGPGATRRGSIRTTRDRQRELRARWRRSLARRATVHRAASLSVV